jgi:hypothetical protein
MTYLLVILLVIVGVFLLLFQPEINGRFGEWKIGRILSLLDTSKYKIINGVVLKIGDKTTQIDHVIVSNFGIFVIETKNYSGWILGGENAEYWTQIIFKRKEKFYNPIRQNLGHISALQTSSSDVIYSYQLLHTIKKYANSSLTEEIKNKVFQKIQDSNLIRTYNKQEHIKSIRRRINQSNNSIQQNQCPKCGNDLIQRSGKYGNFIGCSSYPSCKFSGKI